MERRLALVDLANLPIARWCSEIDADHVVQRPPGLVGNACDGRGDGRADETEALHDDDLASPTTVSLGRLRNLPECRTRLLLGWDPEHGSVRRERDRK